MKKIRQRVKILLKKIGGIIMACFVVPAAEAVIVTAAALIIKKKEQKLNAPRLEGASISDIQAEQEEVQ